MKLLNKVNILTLLSLIIIVVIGILFGSCSNRPITFIGKYSITTYSNTDTTCRSSELLLQYTEDKFGNLPPFRLIFPNDSIILLTRSQFYRANPFEYNGIDNKNNRYVIVFPGGRERNEGVLLGIRDSLTYKIIAVKCYH